MPVADSGVYGKLTLDREVLKLIVLLEDLGLLLLLRLLGGVGLGLGLGGVGHGVWRWVVLRVVFLWRRWLFSQIDGDRRREKGVVVVGGGRMECDAVVRDGELPTLAELRPQATTEITDWR